MVKTDPKKVTNTFLTEKHQKLSDTEEVYIAERLFSSSLVAVVTQSAPRKLRVCHFKKGTEICNYSYNSRILSVKMNRSVSGQREKEKEVARNRDHVRFPGFKNSLFS